MGQTLELPPRPAGAPTGSEFINITARMSLTNRENWIYAQIVSGNVPTFLRSLVPVTVSATINGTPHTATYYATPDYLAVGTDADYFLQPMTPLVAQRLCVRLGCTVPTRKMANQIWTNAVVKLNPQPIAPSAAMITVPVFAQHNSMVWTQRCAYTNSFPLGSLVSGDKKDVVISTLIYSNLHSGVPRPVVIYGWHYPTGAPIQPFYNGHEETYADYSHGIRLVQNALTVDGLPNTVTNVLTDPALAPLLSDEGATEGTAGGVIQTPRYTVSPMAPVIITPPRSQTVRPGMDVTFRAVVVGDPPVGYTWQCNGANVAGATGSLLVLSNVQSANAGSYTVTATNSAGSTVSRPAVVRVNTNQHPVLFADDFQSDTSAAWSLFWGAANGVADYTAYWAFDYGATPYTFNGAARLIPAAPSSPENSTRAMRFCVNNNDALGATAAVNIYPVGQRFSGDFALKVELWLNYPGNAGGINSTGSTQHAIFGINHLGTEVNWAAPSAPSSDGVWFAMDGEGGTTATDYRAYVGNPTGSPIDLTASGGGLIASDNAAAIYLNLFPASRFETAGAPGKNWVEVELRQTNNVLSWYLDGTLVAQRANTSNFTAGTIMLGLMDAFASIANPAEDAFVLFNNLRVEDLSDRVRFLSVSVVSSRQVQLLLSAVPGRTYMLEASTNLSDWVPLMVQLAANAPLAFTDTNAATLSARFYRTRSVQ